MGLVTSGIGALAVMLLLDIAINTISLFAFVLAIGIIVDDAIVVAEHVHLERKRGTPGVAAAIRGVRRIKKPLTFAVLTSAAAFVPILFIPGGIGEIWGALPIVIIAMLFISLAESVFILPNHLTHLHGPEWVPTNAVDRFFAGTQERVDKLLNQFIAGPLDKALHFATAQPAVIVAGAIGLLVVSASLLPAGIIKTTLADVVEGDFINAHLEMPDGTPAHRTYEVAMELEAAGQRVLDRLSRERGADAPHLLSGVTVTVGQSPRVEGGGLVPSPTLNPQANVATVDFKLLGAQERNMSTIDIVQAWREEVGVLPYVRGIAYSGEVIDLGNPVEAVLSHPDPDQLVAIATTVVNGLRSVGGIFDVRSDHTPGVREIQLALRPEARTLGLTLEDMALQARAAFFGAEAVRVQRGREEVRVYVRLPATERNAITDIEGYLVRTPTGAEVPLSQVASLTMGTSPPAIRRQDSQRVVTVTADVHTEVISAGEANAYLEDSILAPLIAANPDLSYSFGGEQQQQIESLDALYRGFVLAMLMIFALLAIPLHSYSKPFIIMAIIPFGLIGVILGHLILGISMSAASFMGFFGLSGVVVNDSLVMIDFIEQRQKRRRIPANGDHRWGQGAVPSHHADVGHHVPWLYATHSGDCNPSAVPGSVCGLARDRGVADHYVADGADTGAHGDLSARELAAWGEGGVWAERRWRGCGGWDYGGVANSEADAGLRRSRHGRYAQIVGRVYLDGVNARSHGRWRDRALHGPMSRWGCPPLDLSASLDGGDRHHGQGVDNPFGVPGTVTVRAYRRPGSPKHAQRSLTRLVEDPEQRSGCTRRTPLALFPVADGLVRHVDAPRELDLSQTETSAHAASEPAHVAHRLGIVVARVAGDVLLASRIQHVVVDAPDDRNARRAVGINRQSCSAHTREPPCG